MKTIKLSILVAVIATTLIISNTHVADAAPSGAKQYGAKTATIMKTIEFKQAAKKVQDNFASQSDSPRDKGFKTSVEKTPTVKKELINSEIKQNEKQKAIKTWESYYKKPWVGKF